MKISPQSESGPQVVDEEQYINSDKEEVRVRRAENQYHFYGLDNPEAVSPLETLEGRSLKERLYGTREVIFPENEFNSLDSTGLPAQEVESRVVAPDDNWYPDAQIAKTRLMPGLYGTIDTAYHDISRLEGPGKEAAAKPLVATLFTLGILIHPSDNGNGQTFKCTTLSYLHELVPETKSSYFPIKFSQLFNRKELEITTIKDELMSSFPVPPIEPQNEKETKLLELRNQINEIKRQPYDKSIPYDQYQYEQNKAMYDRAVKMAAEYDIPELLQGLNPIEWKRPIHLGRFELPLTLVGEKIGKELVPAYADTEIKKRIHDYLIQAGHEAPRVRVSIYGGHGIKPERTTYALMKLLGSQAGRDALHAYILDGKDTTAGLPDDFQSVFQAAFTNFKDVEANIMQILGNEDVSSSKVVHEQIQFARDFSKYAPLIDKVKKTDFKRYDAILAKLYRPTRTLTDRDRLKMLEDEFSESNSEQ